MPLSLRYIGLTVCVRGTVGFVVVIVFCRRCLGCDLVRHEACHLAVGCQLLLLAADRLCHILIFAAYVHGRLA